MDNEFFGWVWILVGLITGAILGLFFHRAEWMGGYDSFRRRLVRLGHISFIGLGAINILFAQTLDRVPAASNTLIPHALILGAVTMPLACGLTAWQPGLKPVFVVPVTALIYGVATLCVAFAAVSL